MKVRRDCKNPHTIPRGGSSVKSAFWLITQWIMWTPFLQFWIWRPIHQIGSSVMEAEEYFGKAHIEDLVLQKAKTLLVFFLNSRLGSVSMLQSVIFRMSTLCLHYWNWMNQHHPTRHGAFMLGIASCLSGFHFKGFVNDARGYGEIFGRKDVCLLNFYRIYTLPFHMHSWSMLALKSKIFRHRQSAWMGYLLSPGNFSVRRHNKARKS